MQPIYLDYNATTPIDPRVVEAMLPYLQEHFGNPSSSHLYGTQARAGVETAREQVARLLACAPDEIVFTGGGSELDNLAIKGVAEAYRDRGNHIITSQIEHPAVLNTCRYLERHGFRVTYLPVNHEGMVDPADVAQAITPETILITLMHANNEVGTIQPMAAVSQIAREHGVLFHTDAAQSVGQNPYASRRTGSRPADGGRTQTLCPERDRRVVRSSRSISGTSRSWCRTRTWTEGRNREHRQYCRTGNGV